MRYRRTVYLVLPATSVGGSERRFMNIWRGLLNRSTDYPIRLVTTRSLWAKLNGQTNPPAQDQVLFLHGHRLTHYIPQILAISLQAKAGSVFHYPVGYFPNWHRLLRQEFLASYTNSLPITREKHPSLVWASLRQARRIDVLDPEMTEILSTSLSPRGIIVTRTPGSFVSPPYWMRDFPWTSKKNEIVFLGRLTPEDDKNVKGLIRAIPNILSATKAARIDVSLKIIGHGDLSGFVQDTIAANKDWPVNFLQTDNPMPHLAEAKVILSLQKKTNYPSQSLLEGMASGCLPIITDLGSSRLVASEDFAEFIDLDESGEALASAITRILSLDPNQGTERSLKARDFTRRNFSLDTSLDYYETFYGV